MFRSAVFVGAALLVLAATANSSLIACTGDCNGDGVVTIDEIVLGVGMVLGDHPVGDCVAFDADQDGAVTVEEVVVAVGAALSMCPSTLQRSYALEGTINGRATSGHLRFTPTDEIEPNVVKYTVDSFSFGELVGIGTADFFTLNNTFSLTIDAQIQGGGMVRLTGSAPVLSIPPLVLGEFDVVGDGYTLRFTATQQAGE